jgi:hypothetical protein
MPGVVRSCNDPLMMEGNADNARDGLSLGGIRPAFGYGHT